MVIAQHLQFVPLFGRQRAGDEDRTGILVAGGFAGADSAPRFQIANGIEDAAADLAVGRAGAIGAMLLKGANGQAEEARGFEREAKAARREEEARKAKPPVEGTGGQK
ncbi:MAG TPA: hypothetical protein PLR02_02925 [Rhodocyclaceae bacterium]|nr:hypothetical protein [Rhodocyclaceae bacterium]